MKIRTDFVTNSSSSNYVTINIKNSKLTEIMCAAKVSKESEGSGIDIDESEQTIKLKLGLWADETDIGFPPENISGLFISLSRLLKRVDEYHQLRNYDFAKICKTLEENSEDIISDTESADWIHDAEGYGEAFLYEWFQDLAKFIAEKEHLDYCPSSVLLISSFHYDKENGGSFKGEYSYGKPDDVGEDWRNWEDRGDDENRDNWGDDEDWNDLEDWGDDEDWNDLEIEGIEEKEE